MGKRASANAGTLRRTMAGRCRGMGTGRARRRGECRRRGRRAPSELHCSGTLARTRCASVHQKREGFGRSRGLQWRR